jgi:Fe-S-cluster containining protein
MDILDYKEKSLADTALIPLSAEPVNPCLSCGACCAFYRASFYWGEADDAPSGTVPVNLTERLNNFKRVMIGTNQPNPRCSALIGTICQEVYCQIYEARSSVCREFKVSWEQNVYNPRCDAARLFWGLFPLDPGNYPRAA